MGLERDFLMRQLTELFKVLEKIIRHRKSGEYKDAENEIKYFYECLKIEGDVGAMNIEEFLNFLEKEKKLNNDQIEMVAFVLKEQGEMEKDIAKRLDFFRKSYFLLDKVERESTIFSMNRQMKITELKEYLKN